MAGPFRDGGLAGGRGRVSVMLRTVNRRLLTAAAAALLLAGLAGCGGGQSVEELVDESVAATSAVESFHLVIDVEHVETSDSGLSVTFVDGDVLVPDKLKGKVGGKFLGLSVTTDLVVVEDEYFLKVPFSGWQKIDVDTLPSAFFDPEQGILAVIGGATDLRRDGAEEVGGVETVHVTGQVRAEVLKPLLNTAEGDAEVGIELWIGEDDKLLRRVRLDGPIEPGESEEAVRTVELSRFDEPVQIEAPET